MNSTDVRKRTISEKIALHFRHGRWQQARRLLEARLAKSPDDHWLLTRLASTYYEPGRYGKALKLSKRALTLAPACPLVLWDYACALDMANNPSAAIAIWKKLLRKGIQQVAYGECGEGLPWARSLLNDCKYRIGLSYRDLGDARLAVRYLRSHIAGRAAGCRSIYELKKAREHVRELERGLRHVRVG